MVYDLVLVVTFYTTALAVAHLFDVADKRCRVPEPRPTVTNVRPSIFDWARDPALNDESDVWAWLVERAEIADATFNAQQEQVRP